MKYKGQFKDGKYSDEKGKFNKWCFFNEHKFKGLVFYDNGKTEYNGLLKNGKYDGKGKYDNSLRLIIFYFKGILYH